MKAVGWPGASPLHARQIPATGEQACDPLKHFPPATHFHAAPSAGSYPPEYRIVNMNFELYPTITLRSRSFNALVAPTEILIRAFKRNLNLQHFRGSYMRVEAAQESLASWISGSRIWRSAWPFLWMT